MNPAKYIVTAAVTLWVCAAMQQALAARLGIFGASPDFLLVALTALCLFSPKPIGGAYLGFVAGALNGAIAGANLTHYIFSRVLGGFLAAKSRNPKYPPKAPTIFATMAGVTLVSQIVLMFFAPPSGIAGFLGATILSALYNGVLCLPLHALLQRILKPVYR
ncbi:MAG: hypothetical protein KF784_04830 [Fimbriimonadaceae bacterium]|nr:hypothetical protein [Fimbriimonadaceae bacterium]